MLLGAAIHADPVGLAAAFAAGFISFASPCVWPLVPAYLSFVSGVAFADLGEQTRRVVIATAAFVVGFGLVFTLAGVGAGVAGAQFADHRRTLEIAGGILVVIMGAVLLGAAGSRLFSREWRLHPGHRPAGIAGAMLAGVAFAIGWTPCIGPTLTAILGLAAQTGHGGEGAALLAAYSLGLGVPFVLSGVFFTRALATYAGARRHAPTLMRVAGALLIVAGVLLATGEMTAVTRELSGFGAWG